MPEYLAPGVYVEEIEGGPRPIEGVPTGTAAFLGETERGPTVPTLVTSYVEFVREFGGIYDPGKYLPYAIKSFFENGGRRAYVARIAGAGSAASTLTLGDFAVAAIWAGVASDRIFVRIEPGPAGRHGFQLQIFYWDPLPPGARPFDPVADAGRAPRPSLIEVFNDLSLEPESPDHWEKRVNGTSSLVTLRVAPTAALPVSPMGGALAGGANGAAPGAHDYEGADRGTGLAALAADSCRDVAIVCAPGAGEDVARSLVAHCERERFRFAVIDSPAGTAVSGSLDPRSTIADSKYAAFYHPWIAVADPRSGNRVMIPPSGAVCGIYARTDETRGVWKAPANETVAGALDLEFDVTQSEQEILNPRGVNVIRRFPGRGIRLWGARTLSSDPLWKYANVRRLFIFLEASIVRSTQWVIFEPNEPKLWAQVKQTLTDFLHAQWRAGALPGDRPEKAFFVAVGRETMTQADIDSGRLVVEVGIAPVRPAEFVIFRIGQWTLDATRGA